MLLEFKNLLEVKKYMTLVTQNKTYKRKFSYSEKAQRKKNFDQPAIKGWQSLSFNCCRASSTFRVFSLEGMPLDRGIGRWTDGRRVGGRTDGWVGGKAFVLAGFLILSWAHSLYFIQVSVQVSPPERGLPWPPYCKTACHSPLFSSL